MKREVISNKRFNPRIVTVFFWKQCVKCRLEVKKEMMWKFHSLLILDHMNTYNNYYMCMDCAGDRIITEKDFSIIWKVNYTKLIDEGIARIKEEDTAIETMRCYSEKPQEEKL